MGIESAPNTSRLKAYDNCNATWRKVAAQASGEIIVANGETILTGATVLAPSKSGGVVLGSGAVERVLISVPAIAYSGMPCGLLCNSGLTHGVWVGGRSGTGYEPQTPGFSGTIASGFGLFIEPGHQKEIYVRKLEEIHVAGHGIGSQDTWYSGQFGSGYDGWPVTYAAEVIVC